MRYTYWTQTGPVGVDVDEKWLEILKEMDRDEYNSNQKETRRHVQLDTSRDNSKWLDNNEEPIEDTICRLETAEALDEAIATLTAKQRDVFMAIHFYGFNISEVAKIKELNKSTVARHLNAAEKKLKNFL